MKKLFLCKNIITMENAEPDSKSAPNAVLVENGVVLKIGQAEKIKSETPDCEVINLGENTLMPSFIDPHSHFTQTAFAILQVSLNGCKSAEEIKERVNNYIKENNIPKSVWINARDYDNNLMPEKKNPPLSDLDEIAPENPLVIQHKSGHMGLINSLGLKALGVTEDTPSPKGGKIGKDGGKLNGYMEENAFFEYLKKIPMPNIEEIMCAFSQAQRKYASYGITTIQDGMFVEDMFPIFSELLKRDILNCDIVAYSSVPDIQKTKNVFSESMGKYDKRFKIGGLKMFLDGSPQGKTAWMRTPYKGTEDYFGYPTMDDEDVIFAFETAAREHLQIIAHCNGDAAAGQFLRCLEIAEKKHSNLKDLRPVMIHAQLIGIDQLQKAFELGVILSFFVAHVYHWGDVHIENFGKKRAEVISPAASAQNKGIIYTFHQDSPVIEPDMLETIWCAANRVTKNGVELGKEECVSVYDALKAVTVNAAYQYGEENDKGSISVGKKADFVVLSDNPLETDKAKIREIKVLKTFKEGNLIFDIDN